MRMGNSIPQNHEDHIAGKGENSLQHYNLVGEFIYRDHVVPRAKLYVPKEYVRRACEPRICIMWTSSFSLHVAILVQVCSGFVTAWVLFSVSLRQQRSSCSSMAGPWGSLGSGSHLDGNSSPLFGVPWPFDAGV